MSWTDNIAENKRMIILQGISGSGKSTFAKKLVEERGEKFEIVCRDEIRQRYMDKEELESYFAAHLDPCFEDFVTTIEHNEIASILSRGHTAILDNTNIRKKYAIEYIKIALDMGLTKDDVTLFSFYDSVTPEQAHDRVMARRERYVDIRVIEKQFESLKGAHWTIEDCFEDLENYVPKQWFLPKFPVIPYEPKENKPKAIICDIDGTTAHRAIIKSPYPHLRSFYDYEACNTDIVDPTVFKIVFGFHIQGHKIIFLSGRKNDCRKQTEEFLCKYYGRIPFELFMRDPQKDVHDGKDDPDDIVKYRIFNERIRYHYDVECAIDDRKRVLALWEALGIKTINVGKLNEVF